MRLFAGMLLVGVAHVALFVAMYWGRVEKVSPAFGSDALVLLAPTTLAFGGFLTVAWIAVPEATRSTVDLGRAAMIAFAAVVVSTVCAATIAFNLFGT